MLTILKLYIHSKKSETKGRMSSVLLFFKIYYKNIKMMSIDANLQRNHINYVLYK